MTTKPDLAYLGPEGTFSDILSKKRYGQSHHLVLKPTIDEVFDYVQQDPSREGMVPIENSSGGMIHSSVDRLVSPDNTLLIREGLSIRVNLALAGHKGRTPLRVYSHFAPLNHCDKWLNNNLPEAKKIEVASTAEAAKRVAADPDAAALCTRDAARLYSLEILKYPVEQNVENITQFYCIGHHDASPESNRKKTSMILSLPNTPGALVDLLLPFKEKGVNLTRILSRPIPGRPQEYIFFIDLQGSKDDDAVKSSIQYLLDHDLCVHLKILGSYPVSEIVDS
jgi:prephenate dehydratase